MGTGHGRGSTLVGRAEASINTGLARFGLLEENAMVTVGMDYHVIPGKQSEFEAKFAAVLEALKGADGHVESHLYRDVQTDTTYLIVSEWSSQDRFTEFIRSQAFKDVTNWGKAEILTDRPRHRVFGARS